jgi:spore maturation protein CgeB
MYLTNRGEIPVYQERGVNARFMTGGCDPTAHRMTDNTDPFFQSDVAFIGKPNTPERAEFMQILAKKFDLKLWGSGWERFGLSVAAPDVYASEYRKICAGAKIILGWNIDPTIDLYFSNRTWYTLGCGGFLLTAYTPSLEEIFDRGKELDWFESVGECCDKIEYYLQHDQERRKIARAGYQLAHNEYSYDNMVERIIGDLHKEGLRPHTGG